MVMIVVAEIQLLSFCLFTIGFYIVYFYNYGIEEIFMYYLIASFLQSIRQCLGEQGNSLGNIPQTIRTMIYCIHSRHVCQQSLGGTNIRSGFFSFNMLFSC